MQNNEFTNRIKEASPVPERISPENIEKKIQANNRSKITLRKRIISTAAALAIVVGGTAGYLYNSGYFDKKDSYIKTTASSSSSKTDGSSSDDSQTGTLKTTDDGVEYLDSKTVELTGLKSLSYEELNDYLKENYENRNYYYSDEDIADETDDTAAAENATGKSADGEAISNNAARGNNDSSNKKDYSDTYTQEEGIDEADIIKTNGKDIFYLLSGNVFAIDSNDGDMKGQLIDFTELYGDDYKSSYADEMYLDGGKLTIILQSHNPYRYRYWIDEEMKDVEERETYKPTVNVITLDVNDIDNIKPTGKYTIQGSYQQSRMADGKLYLSVTSPISYNNTYDRTGVPDFAPVYTINGEEHYISSGDIFVSTDISDDVYGCTTVSLLDTDSACRPVGIKSVVGTMHEVYQTGDRLVLAGTYYDYTDETYKTHTRLAMFDTKDGTLCPLAGATLDGQIKDRYSLDYEAGVLSVVVNESYYDNENYEMHYNNYLYTFNDKLEQLGKSENFGEGEVIKSVTFQDGYAYIVTFMQTDPLFAIDLADPKNPKIVSELKMPGFSTHLRAFTAGRLIGFGNTANEDTGRTTGLKLSIYDNSDPNNVKELDKVEMNQTVTDNKDVWLYSQATYDEKALLIDADKNIIAFPYVLEEDEYDTEKYIYSSGYRFYSYTEGKGFELMGEYKYSVDIKNFWNDEANNNKDPYISFTRAIYIGDVFYLFSNKGVVSLNSKTFEVIDEEDLSALIPERVGYYYDYDDLIIE